MISLLYAWLLYVNNPEPVHLCLNQEYMVSKALKHQGHTMPLSF